MLGVAPFFLLLAVLVSPSQGHPLADGSTVSSCANDYLEKLNKTLRNEDCEGPLTTNCCQLKAVSDILLGIHVKTGVYELQTCLHPTFNGNNQARCDMDSDNGGWTLIQRRVEDGTVDFYRDWSDYEDGFGDPEEEFWYGLKNIHCLTSSESMEMRMDMEDESGKKITWTYQEFSVEGPGNNYRLHIGGGEGPSGTTDHMSHNNLKYFSTKDRDNDQNYRVNCVDYFKGGWWYYSTSYSTACTTTNPNGQHDSSVDTEYRVSSSTTGTSVYYPNFEMKIRPKSCIFGQISRLQNAYCN